MAIDKAVDSIQLNADLATVANAIRAKGGTSAQLSFPGGMAQAIAAIQGAKTEETFTATPSLSPQSISPSSGKVFSGGTVNPITAALLTSLDADFVAENIKKNVDLFGLIGTLEGGGGGGVLHKTIVFATSPGSSMSLVSPTELTDKFALPGETYTDIYTKLNSVLYARVDPSTYSGTGNAVGYVFPSRYPSINATQGLYITQTTAAFSSGTASLNAGGSSAGITTAGMIIRDVASNRKIILGVTYDIIVWRSAI